MTAFVLKKKNGERSLFTTHAYSVQPSIRYIRKTGRFLLLGFRRVSFETHCKPTAMTKCTAGKGVVVG